MNGLLLPFAAIAAGVVSASSPCVLPVLPGYIAAVSATDRRRWYASTSSQDHWCIRVRRRFHDRFHHPGATASALGGLLFDHLDNALRVAGVVLVVFGLHTLGVLPWSALAGERRPVAMHLVGRGPRRAVALGAAFALGWTPCIGPILATILTKAAADSSLIEGMLLLLLYSVGLGLPFIAVAVWFEKSQRPRQWMMRRSLLLQRIGGATMVAVGIGYVTGVWATIFTGLAGMAGTNRMAADLMLS